MREKMEFDCFAQASRDRRAHRHERATRSYCNVRREGQAFCFFAAHGESRFCLRSKCWKIGCEIIPNLDAFALLSAFLFSQPPLLTFFQAFVLAAFAKS